MFTSIQLIPALLLIATPLLFAAEAPPLPDLDQVISPAEQRQLDAEKLVARREGRLSPYPGLGSGVDLRNRDASVKKQVGKACTAFGLTAALENALDSEDKINLSERYFWSLYGKYSAATAIQTALANKLADEDCWPLSQSSPNAGCQESAKTQLTSAPDLGGDLNLALQALDRGHAVYIAIRVPADMASCRSKIAPDSPATHGGHALAVVGYLPDSSPESGGGSLILKNSWGSQCGDGGYQYLPFRICERSDMYCKFWEIAALSRQ